MAVAAGVVCDERVRAVLAARDMPAESRRAAALDRRHYLQLVEADMAGVGVTPRRSMAAEDIRDLQSRTPHRRRALAGRSNLLELECDMLQRAHHLLDRLGGNPRIERRVLELGVTEQNLDDSNIGVLFKQMGSEAVPQRVQRHVLLDPGCLCGGMAGTIELTRGHRLYRVAAWKQPALRPCRPPPGAQQL